MAARAGGRDLAYVYGGNVYGQQPVMLSKLGYYWHKLVNYFYPSGQPPVFGVVSSSDCDSQSVGIGLIAQLLQ
ncbi:hypothetical protein PSQ90_03260 [Devosia rhodophyticola]|uniref:ROK family protein n=1 Tax=Devosia rhodophyticola TaxID=3026423 RepID=A0ABY7YZ28_9HYPH|nr:hypothetical protein [Devosia rhodophyticola]WDR06502.1 hypothetical protein PSQ90_03260 [Devosia rhodophyticola]